MHSQRFVPSQPRSLRRTVRLVASLLLCMVLAPLGMGSACMIKRPKLSSKASYGQNAKQLYEYAGKLLKAGNYEQARKEYQSLKTKYPFSRYATLAEVGIADTHFQAGKYLLAIDAYKLFVKLHPTHPRAGYAAYQAAIGYDKLRPWDWFLVPPSYEKDSTTTKQAVKAYREYIQEYPTHKNVPQAKKRLKQCLKTLGKHEMIVGMYYKRRGKHRAVVWRMDHLLKTYPKVGLDAEARYHRAEALVKLKRYKRARAALKELLARHAKSRYAGYGKSLLARIPDKTGKPPKRRTEPTPRPAIRQAVPAPTQRPLVPPPNTKPRTIPKL